MRIRRSSDKAPRFVFLLQAEFPANAFILASEVLRIANQNSGRWLFETAVLSETGQAVRASNGMWITPDGDIGSIQQAEYVLLFGGNLPTQHNSPRLLAALRTARRFGSTVIGVDTGTFALAQAGLVKSKKVTLHWEAMPAYAERFPESMVEDCLHMFDGNIGHCAGGIATLDLMLKLIEDLGGRALADEVANALVHTRRDAEQAQRPADSAKQVGPSFSRRLISLMEENLDFPLATGRIAERLGVSTRTLERQCNRHFGQAPAALYLKVRLQAARNLLFYEDLSVKTISLACGFSYPSVFSRAFMQQFGQSPRSFRAAVRAAQDQTLRPELHRLTSSQL
jgi:transcriptional regulator GlxA family with amidase domain